MGRTSTTCHATGTTHRKSAWACDYSGGVLARLPSPSMDVYRLDVETHLRRTTIEVMLDQTTEERRVLFSSDPEGPECLPRYQHIKHERSGEEP